MGYSHQQLNDIPSYCLSNKKEYSRPMKVSPVVIASQAWVALAGEIGELLSADIVAILTGERPGLRSSDSLSLYMNYAPKAGCSNAGRNCISNICSERLSYSISKSKMRRRRVADSINNTGKVKPTMSVLIWKWNYEAAAKELLWLAKEAIRRKLSGITLKDESSLQEMAVIEQYRELI
jgi:ethanolamine ammonia-lyase small subunit